MHKIETRAGCYIALLGLAGARWGSVCQTPCPRRSWYQKKVTSSITTQIMFLAILYSVGRRGASRERSVYVARVPGHLIVPSPAGLAVKYLDSPRRPLSDSSVMLRLISNEDLSADTLIPAEKKYRSIKGQPETSEEEKRKQNQLYKFIQFQLQTQSTISAKKIKCHTGKQRIKQSSARRARPF